MTTNDFLNLQPGVTVQHNSESFLRTITNIDSGKRAWAERGIKVTNPNNWVFPKGKTAETVAAGEMVTWKKDKIKYEVDANNWRENGFIIVSHTVKITPESIDKWSIKA